jgi:ParB-like chromosome segregation protein Spo0J
MRSCEVPTIRLEHLAEAQKRAFMIADNRLTEIASWDDRLLAEQLQALSSVELDFDIETIGFDMGEIDLRIESLSARETSAAEPPIPHLSVDSAFHGPRGAATYGYRSPPPPQAWRALRDCPL